MTRSRVTAVHHFGPDPAVVGGIGTVIRVFRDCRVGAQSVHVHPTVGSGSLWTTLRRTTAGLARIRRLGADDVVHVHLSERGSFLREGVLLRYAHRRGLRVVASLHGAKFLPFARARPRLVAGVLSRAAVVAALDEASLETARRLAPEVDAVLLPNPAIIDTGAPPADRTEELVLFAGEIGPRKGADVLLAAWPHVLRERPNARCVMVGPLVMSPPEPQAGLEVRPPAEAGAVRELIRQARVVALPSRAEAMPMILIEAMGAGRPFVGTPVGSVAQMAAAGGGVVVPVDDPASLARALVELLADGAEAGRLGDAGRAHCAATRAVEVIDARWRELYCRP